MMGRIFYVNGDYVPEAEATVSVLDRGFLFADGVYEVSTVLQKRLIDNHAHLRRLGRSLEELSISSPCSDNELITIQNKLIELNGLEEGLVYLQVTRGVADRDFGFTENLKPTLVMFTQAKKVLDNPYAETGIRVVSQADLRWKRRDIKTVGLLASSLAKQAAADAGVEDAWLVEDGYVTEGSSNNAYIITQDNEIQTRQLGHEILSGITRTAILKFASQRGYRVIEKAFTIAEAQQAKEAFITSASMFVTAVVSIDGVTIGEGVPGHAAKELRQVYIDTALQKSDL